MELERVSCQGTSGFGALRTIKKKTAKRTINKVRVGQSRRFLRMHCNLQVRRVAWHSFMRCEVSQAGLRTYLSLCSRGYIRMHCMPGRQPVQRAVLALAKSAKICVSIPLSITYAREVALSRLVYIASQVFYSRSFSLRYYIPNAHARDRY